MGLPASTSGISLPPARSWISVMALLIRRIAAAGGTVRRSLRYDARIPRRDVGAPGLHRSITVAAGGGIVRDPPAQACPNANCRAHFCELDSSWITRSPEMGRHAEELLAISTEHRLPFHFGWATAFHGASLTALGQAHEGLSLLTQGLAAIRATGAVTEYPDCAYEARRGLRYGSGSRPTD